MEKFTSGTGPLAVDGNRKLLVKLLNNLSNLPAVKVSAAYPLTQTVAFGTNFNHGLTSKPVFLRAVLVCTTADAASGIQVGQEIGVENFLRLFALGSDLGLLSFAGIPFSVGCDDTKVYLNYWYSNVSYVYSISWLGLSHTPITSISNFSIKAYYY